jgi:hypothetical protein
MKIDVLSVLKKTVEEMLPQSPNRTSLIHIKSHDLIS